MQEHADISLSHCLCTFKVNRDGSHLTIQDDKTLQLSSEHRWHDQEQRKTPCTPAKWILNSKTVLMDDSDNF